jgi:prolyl oligopeptidase
LHRPGGSRRLAGPHAAALKDSAMTARHDDDPHLWLEDVTGDAPLAWARARNAETMAAVGTGDFAALEARIRAFLDSDTRIPDIVRCGRWYYNLWRDAAHPRGLWRRTTLDEYRKDAPAWESVLDVDALAAAEGENWVWQGAQFAKPAYARCLVHLSRGGADASVVREFDVLAKAFVPGGFALPEAKTNVHWRDDDSVFVATDFGEGSLTTSGYPRVVKLWRRGSALAEAATVFEGEAGDVYVAGWRDRTPGFERDLIVRATTFFTNEIMIARDGAYVRFDKPASALLSLHRDLAFIALRDDWDVGGARHPAGSLLAIDCDAFLAGVRDFAVLFAPGERTHLHDYAPTRHHVLLNELDNVRNRIVVLTRDGSGWRREPLPGLPALSTVSVRADDEDASDDYFVTVTDNVTPTRLLHGTIGGGPPALLKALPPAFAADGLALTQHEAVSRDGTRVPYFEVARHDLVRDGRNPTLLTGYGGFQISRLPEYNGTVGMAWLERGGVHVVANIRGGGEFGPRWHEAARREARPRAYEDFIAVAEDLVRRQVTAPAHLGIMGGSNGGLLVGNALTLRPDLFGAVVCNVPLLDMRRYHRLLAGASWMAEFGDPDDPRDWAYLRTFSPYHNLREGVRYPPVLLMTSTRDDRVHPGHARKMAQRMRDAGHDVLYFENLEGGHGGAADNAQLARMGALQYAFLRAQLA